MFAAHADCLVAVSNEPRLDALGVIAVGHQTDQLTPRARRLWAGAATVAREFGHDFVGTEHLLLAMVREPGGVAGRVLDELAGRDRIDENLSELLRSDKHNEGLREETD
jgi:ATP-dependent Clp protease ATP-binding subunit ClpA